ncbi:MAG: hypothetical protein ACFFAV_17090 [Candidatus Hermodarchaeota archaeon]
MESTKIIISELKGTINSNPEILYSFPPLDIADLESKNLITKFLPFGSKSGEFISSAFGMKKTILSYIFTIKNVDNRANLVSISIIIDKKANPALYKPALREIIEHLEENSLLTEDILKSNLETIFIGINEEKEIQIENISINLSSIFNEIKTKLIKPQPKLKGSFF